MKKNFKYYAIIWALLFAIFNIAVFVTPNEAMGLSKFAGAFWSGYIFISIAFLGQLAVAYFAFSAKNTQKFFYNIPLVRISRTGVVLTTLFGIICMVVPNLPNWVGIVLCFAVLAFNTVSLIKASAAAENVNGIDIEVKEKTSFVKMLTVDADTLVQRAKTAEIKAECKKVYEAIKYSDPKSCPVLSSVEDEILVKMSELKTAVKSGALDDVKTAVDETVNLIVERNAKCKAFK